METPATKAKFDVVIWMTEQGHVSYGRKISDLESQIDLIKGEAGPHWQFCQFTMAHIEHVRCQIEEIRCEAEDRYQDWATDCLP